MAEVDREIMPLDFLERILIKKAVAHRTEGFCPRDKTREEAGHRIIPYKAYDAERLRAFTTRKYSRVKKSSTKYSMAGLCEGKYGRVCHIPVAFPLIERYLRNPLID